MNEKEPVPKFLQAAQQIASEEGKTLQQVLVEDVARLSESKYPSPDCLEPHEIDALAEGSLSQERITQLQTCTACSAVIAVFGKKDKD